MWRAPIRGVTVIGIADQSVVFGHRSQLWWDLTAREGLQFLGLLYGLSRREAASRIAFLSDALDMPGVLDRPVRELSLGQRMRCEIAAGLVHRPRLLLLDKPTIGLDLLARVRLRRFLASLTEGTPSSLILSSHDTLDVEGIADRCLLLDRGRLVYDGPLAALDSSSGERRVRVSLQIDPPMQSSRDELAALGDLDEAGSDPASGRVLLCVPAAHSVAAVEHLLQTERVLDLCVERPTIEEIVYRVLSERREHLP